VEKPVALPYKDITKTEHKITETKDERGKVTTTKILDFFGESGNIILKIKNPGFDGAKFSELIEAIIAAGGEDGEYQTSLQFQSLTEMEMPVKVAYIKLISNYLHHETENIDNKEYAEIITLIVRNNVDNESRFILRQYIMNKEGIENNDVLIKYLVSSVDEGSLDGLKQSLMQDIVRIFRIRESTKEGGDYSNWKKDTFIREVQESVGVTDEQINFFFEKLQADDDIINKRQTNKDIEKTLKSLAAKAGGIGIPLAALYFSGSLWVFGGSLFLWGGLGPIAIAAGLGFLGYQGIKKLTGISEIEDNGQREMMLQGVIRNSQKSLNFLIEDVNYITIRLAEELQKGQGTAILIQKLKAQLLMLSQSAATMTVRVGDAEKEAIIAKLPAKLDIRRFEELTAKPTVQKYRPKVLSGYIPTKVEMSDGATKTVQALNFDLSLNELEEIYSILDNVGYFNIKDAGLASAKGFVKDLFSK
jgi:primosomal protein N''